MTDSDNLSPDERRDRLWRRLMAYIESDGRGSAAIVKVAQRDWDELPIEERKKPKRPTTDVDARFHIGGFMLNSCIDFDDENFPLWEEKEECDIWRKTSRYLEAAEISACPAEFENSI